MKLIFLLAITMLAFPAHAGQSLFTWFTGGESTVVEKPTGPQPEMPIVGGPGQATLPEPLANFVVSKIESGDPKYHFTRDDFGACYGYDQPNQFYFLLRLSGNGITFIVPFTSNYSCGDEIFINFKQLAPYLNKKGLWNVSKLKHSAHHVQRQVRPKP
jgi:hypothetical protein